MNRMKLDRGKETAMKARRNKQRHELWTLPRPGRMIAKVCWCGSYYVAEIESLGGWKTLRTEDGCEFRTFPGLVAAERAAEKALGVK